MSQSEGERPITTQKICFSRSAEPESTSPPPGASLSVQCVQHILTGDHYLWFEGCRLLIRDWLG